MNDTPDSFDGDGAAVLAVLASLSISVVQRPLCCTVVTVTAVIVHPYCTRIILIVLACWVALVVLDLRARLPPLHCPQQYDEYEYEWSWTWQL
jgi:hypothetical protein